MAGINAATSPLSQSDTWDLVSPGYTEILLPVFTAYAKDALAALALPPEAQILDVATGPGTLPLLAAPKVAQVTAIDFSPAMVKVAREQVKTQGLSNVEVHLEDGQRLPFDNRSFDAAFSLFGLIFFPDRAQGLDELFRVLKPGGTLLVADLAAHDRAELLSRYAHRWPGFDDAALAGWLGEAQCAIAATHDLPGPLPVRLWVAERLPAHQFNAA